MKKIILALLLFSINLFNTSYAIEEVELEQTQEKTLREKLSDVYHLEVEQIDKPYFMLNEILTKKHKEESPWESTQLWFGYNADLGNYFNEDGYENSRYNFYAINSGVDGKLKDNKADYRIMLH